MQGRMQLQGARGVTPAAGGAPVARRTAAALHTRYSRSRAAVRVAAAAVDVPAGATRVKMQTLDTCQLAVSYYPIFAYKAKEGGGMGAVRDLGGGKLELKFNPAELLIPALNYKTASIFGVPIPPPLNIAIEPRRFEGTLDTATGVMELRFEAQFVFTAGSLYKAPPLIVETVLTTEHSEGQIRKADGTRLAADGTARLVGVARVPRVEDDRDWWTNLFLMLPTDALAVMDAKFDFSRD